MNKKDEWTKNPITVNELEAILQRVVDRATTSDDADKLRLAFTQFGEMLLFAVLQLAIPGFDLPDVFGYAKTVETLDGKPSAHFEHTVAITLEGPEILTQE